MLYSKKKLNLHNILIITRLSLKLSSSKEEITFFFTSTQGQKLQKYKKAFSLQLIHQSNEELKCFQTTPELMKEFNKVIDDEKFEIVLGPDGLGLTLFVLKTSISFFVPLEQKDGKPLSAATAIITEMNNKINFYENELNKLVNEINHLKEQNNLLTTQKDKISKDFEYYKKHSARKKPQVNSWSGDFDVTKLNLKKEINQHDKSVTALCLLKDGRLASSSEDKLIKIYSLLNDTCDLTLKGHTDGVSSICTLEDDILLSSSWDQTIRVWKIQGCTYQCLKTIDTNYGFIFQVVKLSKYRFASCSRDNAINIWKGYGNYNCLKIMLGHTDWVKAIIETKNNQYLVSASCDQTLRFWKNGSPYNCLNTIYDVFPSTSNSLLELYDQRLLSGGFQEINIIDISDMKLKKKIAITQLGTIYSILQLKDGTLLCGSQKALVQLDPYTLQISKIKEESHKGNISALLAKGNSTIISSSSDGDIKVWEC